MLTVNDCIPLINLDDEERRALDERPTLPGEVVIDLGRYLILAEDGLPALRDAVLEDLAGTHRTHDVRRRAELKVLMHRFVTSHPSRRLKSK
ncbi:MAG: hypothetical protein ABT940_11210 [Alphaproteobacteria bacterium]